MDRWQKHPYIRLAALALSGIIAFSSFLAMPAGKADALTIFIDNTARVTYTDAIGETFPFVTDTAVLRIINPPIFRNFAKAGDPFSPNGDSMADTLSFSYLLYDHDNSQDTISFVVMNGSDTVRTFADNISVNTGNYLYAWDGRDDTGNILTDGIYTYLLSALNDDGNTSTVSGTITLDITPPSGSLAINNNNSYINTYSVIIDFSSVDNLTGVNTIVISNTSTFANAETRPYRAWDIWTLSNDGETTDTVKRVYVKFVDRVWNISAAYSDTIILDAFPPSVISTSPANGETGVPNTATITAVFSDIMNVSTLNTSTFIIRNNIGQIVNGSVSSQINGNTTTIAFTPAALFTSGETYTATITRTVRDKAVNNMVSDTTWLFTIFRYDTTPPTGTVLIDSGAIYANTTSVMLALKGYDDRSAVSRMYVSNSNFYLATEFPYSETLAWNIGAGEGIKTISVWFRDSANNIQILPASDTITLDMTAPSVLWATPSDSEKGVLVGMPVTIAFNDRLDTSTVNTHTFVFTNSLGNTVPSVIGYQISGNTSAVTITPVSQMATLETYTVIILTSVKDKAGNQMAAQKTWFFVTGDVMSPAAVEGVRSAVIAPNQVMVKWRMVTKNMDGTDYKDSASYVIMRSAVTGGPYTIIGEATQNDTAYIDTAATAGTTYYYTVRAKDTSGNSSPHWVEVTGSGDVIVRMPRDNSRNVNSEIELNIGTENITVNAPAINDNITRIYIPREAAAALYRSTNAYGDDIGVIMNRNSIEEGLKTRNLGTVVTSYEASAYKVSDMALMSDLKFPAKVTVTMRYEVEGGFIKHTSIPSALAKNNLSISYWNGIQWVRMGGVIDMANQTVSITTDSLAKFAITAIDVSKFGVLSAEPNPFTPYSAPYDKVTFSFANPDNGNATLKIYDLTGTIVYSKDYSEIVSSVEWDGKDNSGRLAEDGVYIYQVKVGSKSYTGTIILAK